MVGGADQEFSLGQFSLRCPLNIQVVIMPRQLDIDSFKAMGLHEIIHSLSRKRKEKIWELSELWASPKLTGWEGVGEGVVA